jgi:hypothetical protein
VALSAATVIGAGELRVLADICYTKWLI